ncbi:phage tail assembly chaperone [Pseudoroseicyclus sp. CXY001]|uniref:phage tail assembly chaperone n=1 Tax=Pseudoroseicyclus sp. CXY001 TaxID=3242492 RepID=UPI00357156B0
MSALDWPGLMRLGLGRLRLKPAEFWALSPAELMVMLGIEGGGAMGRERLADLAARFPDVAQAERPGSRLPPGPPDGILKGAEADGRV